MQECGNMHSMSCFLRTKCIDEKTDLNGINGESTGGEKVISVEWESADLDAMINVEPAYTINGTADCMPTVCGISMVEANYCDNSCSQVRGKEAGYRS